MAKKDNSGAGALVAEAGLDGRGRDWLMLVLEGGSLLDLLSGLGGLRAGPPFFLLVPLRWVDVQDSLKHSLLESEPVHRTGWNLGQDEALEQP